MQPLRGWRGQCVVRLFSLTLLVLLPAVTAERHISVGVADLCFINSNKDILCQSNATVVRSGPFHGVATGDGWYCGLRSDTHEATCWGSLSGHSSGSSLGSAASFLDIAAGNDHICGLQFSGQVLCFGGGPAAARSPPTGVLFSSLSLGNGFSCGATRAGAVQCWGAAPAGAPSGTDFVEVASGRSHACAIRASGQVVCWGGSAAVNAVDPTLDAVYLTAGDGITCALDGTSRQQRCWGDRMVAAPPSSSASLAEITCGSRCCRIDEQGKISCAFKEPDGWNAVKDRVAISGLNIVFVSSTGGTSLSIARSSDAGMTWTSATSGEAPGTIEEFALSPTIVDDLTIIILAAGQLRQLLSSTNLGQSWSAAPASPGGQISALVCSSGCNHIAAAESLGSVQVSHDRGSTFPERYSPASQPVFLTNAGRVFAHIGAYNVCLYFGGNIQNCLPDAFSWVSLDGKLMIRQSCLISTDFGATFSPLPPRLTPMCGKSIISVDQLSGYGEGLEIMQTASLCASRKASYAAGEAIAVPRHVSLGPSCKVGSFPLSSIPPTFSGWPRAQTSFELTLSAPTRIASGAFDTPAAAAITSISLSAPCSTSPIHLEVASFRGLTALRRLNSASDGVADFTGMCVSTGAAGALDLSPFRELSSITSLKLEGSSLSHCAQAAPGTATAAIQELSVSLTASSPTVLQLEASCFAGFSGLRVLTLSAPCSSVPLQLGPSSFGGLASLHRLNSDITTHADFTSVCVRTSLSPPTLSFAPFVELASISTVNIKDQGIQVFESFNVTKQQPRLESLYLNGNPGTTDLFQQPRPFAAFPSLKRFSFIDVIYGNYVSKDWRGRSSSLASLNIISLHPQVFDGLSLASAPLIELGDNQVQDLGNVTAALKAFFSEGSQPMILSLTKNNIKAVLPASGLSEFSRLSELFLDSNSITMVDDSVLTSLSHPSLRAVRLEGNPIALANPCTPGYSNSISTLSGGTGFAVCKKCPRGNFCPGDGREHECPAGTYNDLRGQTSSDACRNCPAGSYNGQAGQPRTSCVSCSPGTYSAAVGATSEDTCTPCRQGTFAAIPGVATCSACPAGTYGPTNGGTSQSTCLPCPIGTWSSATGATSPDTCNPCAAGSSTLAEGSSSAASCLARTCPAGQAVGESGCEPCPAGTFAAAGATSCSPCPPGRYSSVPGSADCRLCPAGTFRGAPGANSSALCLRCPLGTSCRSDRQGCNALCPVGSLVSSADTTLLTSLSTTCAALSAANRDAVCKVCAASSSQLCLPGRAEPLIAFSSTASNAAGADIIANASNAGGGSDDMQLGSSGAYMRTALLDDPKAAFISARFSLLIVTLVVAVAVPALVAVAATKSATLSSKLVALDAFSASHPEHQVKNRIGGLFTLAFVVGALGVSASVFMQLGMDSFLMSESLLRTVAFKPSASRSNSVHFGDLRVSMLLLGPQSPSCPSPAFTATRSAGSWSLASSLPVSLADSGVRDEFGLPSTGEAWGTAAGCRLEVLCSECRLTLPLDLSLSVPGSFQSIGLRVRGRDAYAGSSPAARTLVAAPDASKLLLAVSIGVTLAPVSMTYSGTLGSSRLAKLSTGHDLTIASQDVAYLPDPTIVRPDADTVAISLTLEPTQYTSSILIDDKMDALGVITAIIGFVSGLSGGTALLMGKLEQFGPRIAKRCLPKKGGAEETLPSDAPKGFTGSLEGAACTVPNPVVVRGRASGRQRHTAVPMPI